MTLLVVIAKENTWESPPGSFLNAAGDVLTVTIPISATYPTGLTVGTTAPNNVAVVHFRVTVN